MRSPSAVPVPVAAPEKAGPPRLSLVVLPFANIGGDPEQEYFVDGVTESLTTDLSRISGAFVIGRSTAGGSPTQCEEAPWEGAPQLGAEACSAPWIRSVALAAKCRD